MALLGFMAGNVSSPVRSPLGAPVGHRIIRAARIPYGAELVPVADRVRPAFRSKLRSGLLFDVVTGRVLWQRDAQRVLPIASLTKMMTALVVVEHSRPGERGLITREAVRFTGSGVGLLPLGRRVPLQALLFGLLLPSGNDAAIALAQAVARTQDRFVTMMNHSARALGLICTHFSTVSGIIDAGNYSCASDLARLAHAVLRRRDLAPILATRDAVIPFPIKGGKLYLSNNNPLLRARFPGTDGVKTGFTDAAGSCLVASAKRGSRRLAVVLLHSSDTAAQAMELLNRGFAKRAT